MGETGGLLVTTSDSVVVVVVFIDSFLVFLTSIGDDVLFSS
jgi:hypothetical protein